MKNKSFVQQNDKNNLKQSFMTSSFHSSSKHSKELSKSLVKNTGALKDLKHKLMRLDTMVSTDSVNK